MIYVTRSSMPSYEEYCEEIKELWYNHMLTNNGSKHKKLQEKLKNYLDIPHVTLFANGHLALENIIAAMNFPKGSEVITTPFTFISTTNAIVRNGLIPVFCDINDKTLTLDVKKIPELITEKTCAILPVHVYGNVCDIDEIKNIATKHNLKVIYDAAHAFGVKYKEKSIAKFGDATMFSFHATKVFNTIEGGAVCYADSKYLEVLDNLKNFGLTGQDAEYIAGNAKMNEFQAAMGICNLKYIDKEIEKREKLVNRYREKLQNIQGIRLLEKQNDVKSNYAYFPVIFEGYKYTRDEIIKKLTTKNIFARKYFYPIITEFSCYEKFNKNKTPIAKYFSEHVLTLPLYGDLTFDEVDNILDIIIN